MHDTQAYSAASASSPLACATIPRRDPTGHDVQIESFSIDMASLK